MPSRHTMSGLNRNGRQERTKRNLLERHEELVGQGHGGLEGPAKQPAKGRWVGNDPGDQGSNR